MQSDNDRLNSRRRYTRYQAIDRLATEKYKGTGKGISFNDLIHSGLSRHKRQAQDTLKRFRGRKILFTLGNHKPQQYYPFSLKSEIIKARLSKNAPLEVTEVPYSHNKYFPGIDDITTQTLVGYVLPLLHNIPAAIHKIQLKLLLRSESYYDEIPVVSHQGNKGKEHQEIIGAAALVRYLFYPTGRIMVFVECSNKPFRLETEEDLVRLIAFFGTVRDRLVVFLHDRHERIVPDIMQCYLTQCDINRDVKLGDWLQFTGINIQVKHAFHLFRLYIKANGKDTLCRVEESINPKDKSAVEAICNIFNPNKQVERQIRELSNKIDNLVLSSSSGIGISNNNSVSADCNNTRSINIGGSINC